MQQPHTQPSKTSTASPIGVHIAAYTLITLGMIIPFFALFISMFTDDPNHDYTWELVGAGIIGLYGILLLVGGVILAIVANKPYITPSTARSFKVSALLSTLGCAIFISLPLVISAIIAVSSAIGLVHGLVSLSRQRRASRYSPL